jgi:hypothetical protein
MRSLLFAALVSGALVGVYGCGVPVPPPPEAALEGTWELSGEAVQPEISEFRITFDDKGSITRLSYRLNNLVTIYVDESALITSDTTVNDSEVSIIASWFQSSYFAFGGALNANHTLMDGQATYEIVVGGVTIEAPLSQARLTRQSLTE